MAEHSHPADEASDAYLPHKFEQRWIGEWDRGGLYHAPAAETVERKRFVMEMFPYPSGDLHIGHIENYSIADVLARYSRMAGWQVLHPMGYDAFGLPAENAAISRGVDPREWTMSNVASMRESFRRLGCSFDWRAEVITCEPEYYRWNQWLFLRFLSRGLAYRKTSVVNWCPVDKTVLANEQISTGVCWRCGSVPEQRELAQWYLKITDYSDRLLDDMVELQWPESVLRRQQAWIGRQHGAEIDFPVRTQVGDTEPVTVFTTRPDTGWGATFLVLAPEHPLAARLAAGTAAEAELTEFIARSRRKTEVDRVAGKGGFEGMPLPGSALNPFTGESIPVWVSDYVLADYGTGAVMGVPAHDQRDLDFAGRYGLKVRVVVQPVDAHLDPDTMTEAHVGAGVLADSGPMTGTTVVPDSREGIDAVVDFVTREGFGRPATSYRQRDWLVSRQRYWGTPIPVVYCGDCGVVPVPEDQLPVLLPPRMPANAPEEGASPLAADPDWVNTTCPTCGGPARRESDTLDTFFDSSWYFLRYCSPHESNAPFDRAAVERWCPVDYYFGGMDHAVMHLIYARFFVKFLYDEGLLNFTEPFLRLFNQGWITFGGKQMSKSKGGSLTAAQILDGYGADAARVFILFCSPPEADYDFPLDGYELIGRVSHAWLARVWRILSRVDETPVPDELDRVVHRAVRMVTEEIDHFRYNTAIARLMELVNAFSKLNRPVPRAAAETFVLLLAPFAPFVTEELWHRYGNPGSVHEQQWPGFDPAKAKQDHATLIIQINGKVRDKVEVPADADEQTLRALALGQAKVVAALDGREPLKVIVRPPKLVNIVV